MSNREDDLVPEGWGNNYGPKIVQGNARVIEGNVYTTSRDPFGQTVEEDPTRGMAGLLLQCLALTPNSLAQSAQI